MTDVTLSDGTEITIDLSKITLKDWVGILSPKESDIRTDKVLAKACQMEYKEFEKISFQDYKVILKAFFRKCNEPLKDPNSQSASTSD